MRTACWGSLLFAIGLVGAGLASSRAAAQDEVPGWVEPFAALRPGPLDLHDTRAPLEQRIALAVALGEHGPAQPAIAALESALAADPPPPSRLREAIVRSLLRRGARGSAIAREPMAAVLAAAARREPPRTRRGAGADWLARPVTGAPMVRAFLTETDPATLRAMARKLGQLGLGRSADGPALLRALCDKDAAPRALLMLAADAEGARAETTRRVLRAALAGAPCTSQAASAPDDDPEAAALRVLGALALAAIDDVDAVAALRRTLESPYARVRLAAATALAMLATPSACAALASHARVENSALVRSALGCEARDRD